MEKLLLGIDVGTTRLKVTVIDQDAVMLGISSGAYDMIRPSDDMAQLDAGSMWRTMVSCVRRLKADLDIDMSRVAGIGISSLCPGLTAMSSDGEVLVEPIIYSDRRSTAEAEQIRNAVGDDRLFELTANGSMAGAFSGSSMLWIRNHLPDAYRKTAFFGHLNTYLVHRMTGVFGIDYSNASYSNLFETAGGRKWSDELCEAIGIDREKLPDLHEASDVIGGLRAPDLISLGIPKGTPVVMGGADTPCATLAAGVTRAGDVCESVGTTDVLTVCVDRPVFDRAFINRCHVVPGTWIYQGAMSFTGASNEWFLNEFCRDLIDLSLDSRSALSLMNEEADEAVPGCGGVVFLPYMQGERSPVWDPYARGVFFGLSLNTTRKDLNRAILEGCGYGLRQLLGIAENITGQKYPSLSSIGGGAKSVTWAQIKADILGREINILDINDMAPIGAALLAGAGAGVFRDLQDASDRVKKTVWRTITPGHRADDVYEKRYRTYVSLYPALKEICRNNL